MAKLVLGTDKNNTGTSAIVKEKPVPMPLTIQKVNNNGTLTSGSTMIELPGVTRIGPYALAYAYYNNTNISGAVDFSNITEISGDDACHCAFYGCTSLTSVDLSSLTKIDKKYACRYMFYGCTSLTSVDLRNLTTISGTYNNSNPCEYMFSGCTGLTNVILPTSLNVYPDRSMVRMFSGCTGLTTAGVNFETMAAPSSSYQYQHMFSGCTGLTIVSLPTFVNIISTGAMYGMFQYCTSLTSLELKNLVKMGSNYEFQYICQGCTNLINVNLSSLSEISSNACLQYAFSNCTSLSMLRFPALSTVRYYTNQFNNMLSGCSNVTVHFPIAIQSIIGSWSSIIGGMGGTNTTVLFDIVTSLIGVDMLVYTRREKDSTNSATAWENGGILYYTSGIAEPQVSDTLYSDPECTQVVTTIDSIS